jgi:hypothetical protein
MNVRLDYESGQTYTQYFSNFHIKVSGGGVKRLKISCQDRLCLALFAERKGRTARPRDLGSLSGR